MTPRTHNLFVLAFVLVCVLAWKAHAQTAATLSPRQLGQPANKPMLVAPAKPAGPMLPVIVRPLLIVPTNMVLVLASSTLVGKTNYQIFRTMTPSNAAQIVNIIVTNPPPAPKIQAQISWRLPGTLLVSTNLTDWTPTLADVTCTSTFTNDSTSRFYRVPMGSGNLAVTLSWDASPDATVTGYTVWYGTQSGMYDNSVTAPTNQLAVVVYGLNFGTLYFFAATANDGFGDVSPYSNEVTCTFPQEDDQLLIKLF